MTSVYIETSIPSFYFETRQEPENMARTFWTKEWWDLHSTQYNVYTSVAVIDELDKGLFAGKQQALELLNPIPLLDLNEAIGEVVANYISHHIMPNDPLGDALHLAVASYYKCDFLLTWNCHHLANANKFGHIRRINNLLGLYNPSIVTPLELLGESI